MDKRLSIIPMIILVLLARKRTKTIIERWLILARTYLLSLLARRYSYKDVRRVFTEQPLVRQDRKKNQTHGFLTSARESAIVWIRNFAAACGRPLYAVQSTQRELCDRKSRTYYWSKDVKDEASFEVPHPNDIVQMVDVDYYVDMPNELSIHPTVLYTFTPEVAAQATGEEAFTFQEDGTVCVSITGGASYKHQLWNYGQDEMMAVKRFLGIPYQTVVYSVERKSVIKNHSIVLISPVASWGLAGAFMASTLETHELQRFNPAVDGFASFLVHRKAQLEISIARLGSYAETTLPIKICDGLEAITRNTKIGLVAPTVQGYLADEGIDRKVNAQVLVDFFKNNRVPKSTFVFPVDDAVRTYSFNTSDYSPEEEPPSMRAFMSPLIHGAFAPANSLASDRQMTAERVEKVLSKIQMTAYVSRKADEFIRLFVANTQLHPVDYDVVFANMPRKQQQILLKQACDQADFTALFKCFMKRECYQKPNDPRNITTIPELLKLGYSCYMYALADYTKTFDWYAFGKTPLEIAERVKDICQDADHVIITDFSRFDGRVSPLLREFELRLLLAIFPLEYHASITDMHRSQYVGKAVTRHGVWFEGGTSRRSGSPETSIMNTIANAFIAYLTLSTQRYSEGKLSPAAAFSNLGIYGGDDGLTPNVNKDVYEYASRSVGQVLTSDVVYSGLPGVTFLSRYYSPAVWTGSTNSCCDVQRQLRKFHTTTTNFDPKICLIEKARAYCMTDANTPLIGDYCRAVLTYAGAGQCSETYRDLWGWFARVDLEDQYPNVTEPWMHDLVARQLPAVDPDVLSTFLATVNNIDNLLSPPLLWIPPVETKHPIVVDGDIVLPPRKVDDASLLKSEKRRRAAKPKAKAKAKPAPRPRPAPPRRGRAKA